MVYRNSRYEVVDYPLNLIFCNYTDPLSLIHPKWLAEFKAERKTLYGENVSPKEAFYNWNMNREHFYSW